MELIGMYI